MRVGEKSRPLPALSPKRMKVQEDASRESSTPFVESGYTPNSANRLGQRITKTLWNVRGKSQPQTSLNLGIGKQKRNKKND